MEQGQEEHMKDHMHSLYHHNSMQRRNDEGDKEQQDETFSGCVVSVTKQQDS